MTDARSAMPHGRCRSGVWARFDDLENGEALLFSEPDEILVARRVDEVPDVLTDIERATQSGRWGFGYVGYEAAAGLDPTLTVHPETPSDMPLVWFGIGGPPLAVPALSTVDATIARPLQPAWTPGWTPGGHLDRVTAIKARIAAGDTYQCNLTERLTGQVSGDPFALYRDLALGQGGAHNAYLDLGRWVIASASPELFYQRHARDVVMRPMKGTSSRGRWAAEDRLLAERLRTSDKERAENLMIVDLLRNDLSRVAETGSVRVPALFTVERYRTVLQLTSTVTARLLPGIGLLDLFAALFPSGSITGAPKVSSMKIIRTVESEPRGVYCGAIGFVGPPSAPVHDRFSVAIRTAIIDKSSGTATYGTGGGITWGSDPAAEHAEILAKAAVLTMRTALFELLETVRCAPGLSPSKRDAHLRRLADSARYLGFVCDVSAVAEALDDHLLQTQDPVVQIHLSHDGTVRIDSRSWAPTALNQLQLGIDDSPVDPSDWRLYHETSLRAGDVLDVRRRRRPLNVDEVVLINTRGELTETTGGTLALKLNGRWLTPPVGSGCLPNVERTALLIAGRLVERVLRPDDLHDAQALGVINGEHGWRPAHWLAAASAAVG